MFYTHADSNRLNAMSKISRNEEKQKIGYKQIIINKLTRTDFSESLLHDLEWLVMQSEDQIQQTIRFAKARTNAILARKKMGGRKSRIDEILGLAEYYLERSTYDQTIEYMQQTLSEKYAISTFYKALKIFKLKYQNNTSKISVQK